MTDFTLVCADKMKTLEQYAASLISGMATIRTLESFHVQAFSKGLLEGDEAEAGRTILWELRRLLALYKTQTERVLERSSLDEETILAHLRKMVPPVKAPRKKKNA